jgi:hypothetical protein
MRSFFKPIVLLSSLILQLTACGSTDSILSDQVDPDVIHQRYSVTYVASTNKTEVLAQFRVGGSTGTTIELVSPSQVEHSEVSLRKSNSDLLGSFYVGEETGFVADHVFNFTNQDEEVFENSFSLLAIDFPNDLEEVSREEDWVLQWEGDPLLENERVQLILRDSEGDTLFATASDEGATSVTVTTDDLLQLNPGFVQLDLERVLLIGNLQEGGPEGGSRTGIYRVALEITLN